MGWVWGIDQGWPTASPTSGGLYCGYDFRKFSPIYAMDTVWHNPRISDGRSRAGSRSRIGNRNYILQLNGTSQYVELRTMLMISRRPLWPAGSSGPVQRTTRGYSPSAMVPASICISPRKIDDRQPQAGGNRRNDYPVFDGTAALTADRWTHIAVTFSGARYLTPFRSLQPSSNKWTATATLYVDGVAGTPVSDSWSQTR